MALSSDDERELANATSSPAAPERGGGEGEDEGGEAILTEAFGKEGRLKKYWARTPKEGIEAKAGTKR